MCKMSKIIRKENELLRYSQKDVRRSGSKR